MKHESRDRSVADFDACDFDELWSREVRVVDEANRRGAGTSTVGVADAEHWPDLDAAGRVYVKRQQAFFCRPPWNAFRRTPTLRRELRFIEAARALDVNVPTVALYREGSNDRALLVLTEVRGAVDLESGAAELNATEREALFKNIGKTLAKLHSSRIMHGAVYPKHVLIEAAASHATRRLGEMEKVWLIDFEKARKVASRSRAAIRDISRLVRHSPFMTGADLEALVSAYDARLFPRLLERLRG